MNNNYPLLNGISSPFDLRRLPISILPKLASELRAYLLQALNICGGHLSANLGCVELTLALHYVFNTPYDQLVWDTGHQAYIHKILTGRKSLLHTIRQYGGLAPFPTREESIFDCFGGGHCSTSLSAAIGMTLGNRLANKNTKVIVVIGDGAFTAGMAFEAINFIAESKENLLIILNDNQFSISPTIGGFSKYATIFQKMGFSYIPPIDGHNLPLLIKELQDAKSNLGPCVIHVITKKGKGFLPAEKEPIKYHAVKPGFQLSNQKINNEITYSSILGKWLCDKAIEDSRLIVLTPGMAEGSGLIDFAQKFSQRFIDVGVAEQHCVTLAAGLAVAGYKPIVAIYSSFLQRAYDQLIHDVALQNLSVIFAIDRAGIVGLDGPTHGGFFDLSFLRCIPNFIIMSPANVQEYRAMLDAGFLCATPIAIRYPRGGDQKDFLETQTTNIEIGKAQILKKGKKIALLAFGSMVSNAMQVSKYIDATVINMRFIKPLDEEIIEWAAGNHNWLVTLEENVIKGGAGSAVNEYLFEKNISIPVQNLGLPDHFIEHGSPTVLLKKYNLDVEGIINSIEHKFTAFYSNSTEKLN